MLEAPMAQQQQLPQHSVEVVGAAPAPAVLARPRPRLPSEPDEPDSDPNDSHKDDPTVSDVSSATGVELAVAKAALVATGGNRDHAILRKEGVSVPMLYECLHRQAVTRRLQNGPACHPAAGEGHTEHAAAAARSRRFVLVGNVKGQHVQYPPASKTKRVLDSWVQLVVQGAGLSQPYTTAAVRRSGTPRWTFALPASSSSSSSSSSSAGGGGKVHACCGNEHAAAAADDAGSAHSREIMLSICTMAGEPIATTTATIPVADLIASAAAAAAACTGGGGKTISGRACTPPQLLHPIRCTLRSLQPGADATCGEITITIMAVDSTSDTTAALTAATAAATAAAALVPTGVGAFATDDADDDGTFIPAASRAVVRSASAPCENEVDTIRRSGRAAAAAAMHGARSSGARSSGGGGSGGGAGKEKASLLEKKQKKKKTARGKCAACQQPQIGPQHAAGNGCIVSVCGHTVCTQCITTVLVDGIREKSIASLACPACTAEAANADGAGAGAGAGASNRNRGAESDDSDGDSSSDESLEVEEVYFSGKLYYRDDDGHIYDPDTSERVHGAEEGEAVASKASKASKDGKCKAAAASREGIANDDAAAAVNCCFPPPLSPPLPPPLLSELDLVAAGVPSKLLEEYYAASVQTYFEQQTEGTAVDCPHCATAFLFKEGPLAAPGSVADDAAGNTLTKSELAIYNKLRARCPACETVFCAACKASPYHTGKMCGDHARQCRFCEEELKPVGQDEAYAAATTAYPSMVGLFAHPLPPWKKEVLPALKDVCGEEECAERASRSCTKLHDKCEHPCGGIIGEHTCMPCLHCADVAEKEGVAHDDLCTACFTEGISAAPALKLASCGHYMHSHCVEEQIKIAYGGTPTLHFGFMECNICKVTMEHPHLTELLKPHHLLRDGVHKLAKEEVAREMEAMSAEDKAAIVTEGELQYGLRSFVFKQCFKCRSPYSAGKVDCAAGLGGGGGGMEEEMPAERPEDAVCSGCRDSSSGVKTCAKHGKSHIMWKCRYCCDRLASYECFDYLHVCEPCHGYQKLETLLNFNQKVGAGDPLRGGVLGEDRVYANRKQLWEYPQCAGPESCKLGCAHPPHGLEFCFGCSKCFEEAGYARDKLPDALLLLQRADARYGYLVGIESIEDDVDKLKEVDARLKHCLWLFGGLMLADGTAGKRDIIAALNRVCNPAMIRSLRIGGNSKAVAKSKKVRDVVSALESWQTHIQANPGEFAKFKTTVERDIRIAAEWSVEDPVQYRLPGSSSAMLKGKGRAQGRRKGNHQQASIITTDDAVDDVSVAGAAGAGENARADAGGDGDGVVTAVRQAVTFKLRFVFSPDMAAGVDGNLPYGGAYGSGAAPAPGEKMSAVMGKTAKNLVAARGARAKAAAEATEDALEVVRTSFAYNAPAAALSLLLNDRGGSCTGFVDEQGALCSTTALSELVNAGNVSVRASVATEAATGSSSSNNGFGLWWSLL